MRRIIVLFTAALLLTGCVESYTLVSSERTKVGDGFSVAPATAWNRVKRGHTEIWTLDGPALQELRFVSGAKDGDKLFPGPAFSESKKELPEFRSSMTPPEIVELVVASLAQVDIPDVKTREVRPAKFGAADGFRFAFSYTSRSGLDYEGMAFAAIKDKRLYLVMYRAARVHFFDRDRESIERIIDSIKFET